MISCHSVVADWPVLRVSLQRLLCLKSKKLSKVFPSRIFKATLGEVLGLESFLPLLFFTFPFLPLSLPQSRNFATADLSGELRGNSSD